ncbi:MAG: hypothetical protein MUO82_10790 [Candidatus Thermoplasmatota archaeon]|nr:hypothetical protein [Candidatus Thermoplasmatota archaeon]
MTNPVIKKGNRYYNTLTQKYVSESYAKRINSYFERHPDSYLVKAGGHAIYKRKRPLFEHEKVMRGKMYGKGFQVYKTKKITGKTVYYSPIFEKEMKKEEIEYIEKLDYPFMKNVYVELYRMSRDKERIYHILTWTINKSFHGSRVLELWIPNAENTFKKIEKEMQKNIRKYPLGYSKIPVIYCHISNYFYSDIDSYEHGKTFGFYVANRDGYDKLYDDFLNTLAWYINKLEIMAYHNIWIEKISFYIMDFYKTGSIQEIISSYRMGIQRLEK